MFEGALDIVGDVHGEISALTELLRRLGYDERGAHEDGRRLVFVGDLCDRGPDSPGVIRLVRNLIQRGRAQCVVGNHELNILRDEQKHGNHWYFEGDHSKHEESFGPTRRVMKEEACEIRSFLETLPIALERDDLRVVHAAWSADDIDACRAFNGSVLDAYSAFDDYSTNSPKARQMAAAKEKQLVVHEEAIWNERARPPFLTDVATYDEHHQISNPVRVLTSGIERVARSQFFAGGKWRFVERVKWWEEYLDAAPVVFGHYWRFWDPTSHPKLSKGEPNLFEGEAACGWHKNAEGREVAFCVDYSAGARYKERKQGGTGAFQGRLAALRWPEREVVFDGAAPQES